MNNLKRVISILLVITILLLADAQGVRASSQWSAASINFCEKKGIIDDLKTFDVNTTISIDNMLKMFVSAINGTGSDDYVNEAIKLGLITPTEASGTKKNATRADVARIAVKANEKLNSVTYPDYLEAYRTMVTDYVNIVGHKVRRDSLICVSEGLMPMVNGALKQNDAASYGLIATVIHRLLSVDERNKAKPLFATVDKEFEEFMADEEKSKLVCSRWEIDRVFDGKILWKTWGDGVCLLPTLTNKDSNKEAYNSLKTLIKCARKYNHWVETCYNLGEGDDMLQLLYTTNQKGGQYGLARTQDNFRLGICFNNTYKLYSDPDEKNVQKKRTDYIWTLGCLFNSSKGAVGKTLESYQQKELIEPFKALLNAIYEPKLASYLADYMIKDDMKKFKLYDSKNHKGTYTFEDLLYPKQFKGLEIQVKRPNAELHVGTNKIN